MLQAMRNEPAAARKCTRALPTALGNKELAVVPITRKADGPLLARFRSSNCNRRGRARFLRRR